MTLKIAMVAEESAGVRLLRELADTPHDVVAVVTSPAEEAATASVAGVAGDLGLDVVAPDAIRTGELAELLRARECDLLLNAHSLHILPPEVLDAPRLAGYNLHPGPLPEMAGLNVPSWAVFLGHDEHAVTVHRMDPGIDTGPIAYSQRFEIGASDTAFAVMSRCVRAGFPLMLRLVETAADGDAIPADTQDLDERHYYDRSVPNDGWIDWSWPARRIQAFARACDYGPFPSPWGKPRTAVHGAPEREVEVSRVELTDRTADEAPGTVLGVEGGAVEVATTDGVVLLRGVRPGGGDTARDPQIALGERLGRERNTTGRTEQ